MLKCFRSLGDAPCAARGIKLCTLHFKRKHAPNQSVTEAGERGGRGNQLYISYVCVYILYMHVVFVHNASDNNHWVQFKQFVQCSFCFVFTVFAHAVVSSFFFYNAFRLPTTLLYCFYFLQFSFVCSGALSCLLSFSSIANSYSLFLHDIIAVLLHCSFFILFAT